MSLRFYSCECKYTSKLFDGEEIKCEKCGSKDIKRLMSMPLAAKITDKVDSYRNVDMERGIEEDLKKRNKRHTIDTIDEFIEEHGEAAAREAGLLVTKDKGRTWVKLSHWDSGTVGAANKGSMKGE